MGNSVSYSLLGNGGLQSNDTKASGKKFYTNCIFVGCGCHNELMKPLWAEEVRCCCFEEADRVDFSNCNKASDMCACRSGCKTGPCVAEVKNPLIDNHEFVVVLEKPILNFGHSEKVSGVLQSNATRISGKKYHTNCGCIGCGVTDDLCKPILAGDGRCCCAEIGSKVDMSDTQKASDLCKCRYGCKLCPAVVDVKNPLVDNAELIVVAEKPIYGCK
mmetsp:Transcript_101657/g.282963  ORF Transcript_101657/g.282963 Transcript_101657/m.282963 type:complete len:217 (-) Transcript_101657:89-739(-)|eukprot:CAMPEP_0179102752 /NCGR_PEP_ID=MMETSP0796-20121207/47573_1 /TAXON_ID=73915 /ORGANISM="Pyrodinium bahamense, Strain pbaha01" /LENGTH=216 /DNA_ID=CAMNT_0020800635 /DNA_START=96 /DNA_END=746 /DNA_ORIENTATION=-